MVIWRLDGQGGKSMSWASHVPDSPMQLDMKKGYGMFKQVGMAMALIFFTTASYANCWESSGSRYNIPPTLLYAIGITESSLNPSAINRNRNGSEDVGLMQINSVWLPTLASMGISRKQLFDACTSIEVGAWILAQNFRAHGSNWNAVGAYNAGSPEKRLAYAMKIYRSHVAVHQKLSNQQESK